ncbi:MAG: hypothetical protein R3300_19320, partial [Candidatus Promineifilaceae bacterium]|nr:hypothetical protein [Candidatus Promineifilaceae bacterium]
MARTTINVAKANGISASVILSPPCGSLTLGWLAVAGVVAFNPISPTISDASVALVVSDIVSWLLAALEPPPDKLIVAAGVGSATDRSYAAVVARNSVGD